MQMATARMAAREHRQTALAAAAEVVAELQEVQRAERQVLLAATIAGAPAVVLAAPTRTAAMAAMAAAVVELAGMQAVAAVTAGLAATALSSMLPTVLAGAAVVPSVPVHRPTLLAELLEVTAAVVAATPMRLAQPTAARELRA